VPRISSFYGVVVTMYFRDHGPPHFHAVYGEFEAQVIIATGGILMGALPPRALRMVKEWTNLHRAELEANWQNARKRRPLAKIDPLA